MSKKENSNTFVKFFSFVHNQVQAINNSKIFAGLMIITLNIVSKFANFKLSKTLESYFKYTFSRQILVFAIAWMGTRDIYIALFITLLYLVITEHFFHEDSMFFVFPEEFRDYHISLLENEGGTDNVTMEDVVKAKAILEKAKAKGLISSDSNDAYVGVSL